MGPFHIWILTAYSLAFQLFNVSSALTYDICETEAIDVDENTYYFNIESPDYSWRNGSYEPNLDCRLNISSSTRDIKSFKLLIHLLDLEWNETCRDYVTINGKEYCGYYWYSRSYCFPESSLELHFVSDDNEKTNQNHTGFSISVAIYDTNRCECVTEAEEGETAQACVFPFTYQGVTYHQCAGDVRQGEKPFCATQVDQDGALSDESNKKFCKMSVTGCQQKCLTTQGEECLFPNEQGSSFCSLEQESDESASCTTLRYKTASDYGAISTATSGICQMDSCRVVDTCSTKSSTRSGHLTGSDRPYISDTYIYPTNTSCSFEYYLPQEEYFSIYFEKLDIHCEDALRIGDSSDTFSYNLCSIEEMPHVRSLCIPASNVSILFETGNANAGPLKRSGFLASYSFWNRKDHCHFEDIDEACSSPEGRIVYEADNLTGKFYPQPYPANTSCLWTIVTPSDNTKAVLVHVNYADLGIDPKEFEVIDSLKITDAIGRNLVLRPRNNLTSDFISVPGNATVYFESGSLFNWHRNFKLEVSFIDVADDFYLYEMAGLCVNHETLDVCHIPFTYKDKEYKVCDYLEPFDERPSCISYTGKKMVCNESVVACGRQFPVFSTYDVVYEPVSATEKIVFISWDFANDFWESFDVYVDDKYIEGVNHERRFQGVFNSSNVNMRVNITVYGYLDQPKSLLLTIYPDLGIETVSYDYFDSVTIKWQEYKGHEKIKGYVHGSEYGLDIKYLRWIRKFELYDFQLQFGADLNEGTTEYTQKDLTSGISYYVQLYSSTYEENFTLTIPPNPLKEFFIQQLTYNSVIISGKLTKETICYSIYFSLTKINSTTTPRPNSYRMRRDAEVETVECSFENSCINSEGEYSIDLGHQLAEPDTCYEILATTSTADGVKSKPSGTVTHCTPHGEKVPPPTLMGYHSDSELTQISVVFYVNESSHGFDYVMLYFYDSASDSYSAEGYLCSASGGYFASGMNQTCSIPGLKSDTSYNIALKGHDRFMEIDVLTDMSETMAVELEGNDYIWCGSDYFSGGFHFSDILSPQSSFTFQTSPVFTSDYGTPFDDQHFIQNSWGLKNVFVPPESTPLFRGYPSSIDVRHDVDEQYITGLFPKYNFAGGKSRDTGDFDHHFREGFNLESGGSSLGVVSVSGSTVDGFLTNIQFKYENIGQNGSTTNEIFFGSGLSEDRFEVNRSDSKQFLVGFSGKTDDAGRIVDLNLIWVAAETFFLGSVNCPVDTDYVEWFDIAESSSEFHSTYEDCGTTKTVDNNTDKVTYENRIIVRKALSANQTQENEAEDFGDGTMTASRSWSPGGVVLQCVFEADGVVSARFDTTPHETIGSLSQTQAVEFQMLFYTDGSFSVPRSTPNGIITVNSGERVHFAVSFDKNRKYHMTLYAYTCYAKKTDNPDMAEDGSDYLLLENDGCPAADDTFKRDVNIRAAYGNKMDPMSIQAFHWFNDYFSLVHIHCRVRACVSENRKHCQPPTTCEANRARRGVPVGNSEVESFVSSQPIRIQRPENMLVQPMNEQTTVNWIWIPLSLACGLSVAFFVIARDRIRKRGKISVKYDPLPQSTSGLITRMKF